MLSNRVNTHPVHNKNNKKMNHLFISVVGSAFALVLKLPQSIASAVPKVI